MGRVLGNISVAQLSATQCPSSYRSLGRRVRPKPGERLWRRVTQPQGLVIPRFCGILDRNSSRGERSYRRVRNPCYFSFAYRRTARSIHSRVGQSDELSSMQSSASYCGVSPLRITMSSPLGLWAGEFAPVPSPFDPREAGTPAGVLPAPSLPCRNQW